MLKIKDGIDLKELEKFGFEYSRDNIGYTKVIVDETVLDEEDDKDCIFLRIFSDTKEIVVETTDTEDWIFGNLTTLFDLIQAGLVEKVSDE